MRLNNRLDRLEETVAVRRAHQDAAQVGAQKALQVAVIEPPDTPPGHDRERGRLVLGADDSAAVLDWYAANGLEVPQLID